MYPMSTAMQAALKHSHTVATRVELSAAPLHTVYVTDGEVSVDGTAAVRRRCTLTMVDPEGTLTPANASAVLAPFGNELKLWRGVQFPDGSEELVPLGVFVITQVTISDGIDGTTLQVEGLDRSIKVQRARFLSPYVIQAGANYGTAIRDAIASRNPWASFDFQPVTQTTPQLILGEQVDHDPWKETQAMAASIGCELYFDANGICTLRQVSTASTASWTYTEGREATLLGLSRKLTAEGTYNHVIVTGESASGPPVKGEAKDVTPGSPTNVNSAYGDVPYFYASPLVVTQAQATQAAEAILTRVMGRTELVEFPAIVNPGHEAGDVVQITRAASKVADLFIIDTFTIPLNPRGTMKATTRKRQV